MLLAGLLRPGDVLPLWGEFGAGKTTFVQGVARGLGVAGVVASPSFGLIHSHRGDDAQGLTLYHLDLYRVGSLEEAMAFGADEVLGGDGVALIEWPEVLGPILLPERLDIFFEPGRDEERLLRFEPAGERYAALLGVYAGLLSAR